MPPEQHAVVVAGPGTGKTTKLAKRARWLVGQCGVLPEQIALLTFTNSTTRHLQTKIPELKASTVHSFALYHLNAIGESANRRIADEWEQDELIRRDLCLVAAQEDVKVGLKAAADFLRRLGAGFREGQEQPPQLSVEEQILRRAWLFLRGFLGFRLFDELAYDLLRSLEQGGRLKHPPRVILVDEYQDLTPCELALLKRISEVHCTAVFVCGDDRQSINGFRDADPRGLNNFCRLYGVARPWYLSTSYRCPRLICEFAESIAQRIPPVQGLEDRPKLSPHPDSPHTGTIRITIHKSVQAEAKWLHREVSNLLQQGVAPSQIMVVVARDVDVYVNLLNRHAGQDNYYDPRSGAKIADSMPFRTIYALARVALDKNDLLAWRTLMQLGGFRPPRMRQVFTAGKHSLLSALRARIDSDEEVRRWFEATEEAIARLQQLEEPGDSVAIAEEWFTVSGKAKSDFTAVNAMLHASLSPTGRTMLENLEELLRTMATDPQDASPDSQRIPVRTIHQAKGLEAEHVFLAGAHDEAFADVKPADGVRRLYVAVTRASRSLTISVGRSVRRTPIEHRLGASYVKLATDLEEVSRSIGITIECDPDQ
ncbi:MAG: ATP-dependent helicase [Bacillota bacterium]|nr:ATP-dependent helicase [Bacillota bacterium]